MTVIGASPVGRNDGAISSVRSDDLAALVIRKVLKRTGIDPALINKVYFGCTSQAGEDDRNIATRSEVWPWAAARTV